MSDKKMYSPAEVAKMILDKTQEVLKKHEEVLFKSKNTAHEIDAGEEPKNDEAECPDSLKGEGASSASKSEPKKDSSPVAESEDSEMEDEPLSDDESEEDESEEDEEEEKFEFKKSESGMHTIEYKRIAKKEKPLKKLMSATSTMPGSVASTGGPSIGSQIGFPGIKKEEKQSPKENPQYHIRATNEGKAPKKPWTSATRKEVDYSRSGMKNARPSNPEDQKRFEAEAKERSKKMKEQEAKKNG
jgi:hypothetical protein